MSVAAVGFGANLGDPARTFAAALDAIAAHDGVRVESVSSLWRSAPWGRTDQPEFLNAAALLVTSRKPHDLLARLRAEEDRAGRERGETWGPRTLDLDLLFFDDRVLDDDTLTLPHPRLADRSFVLEPLSEIAPAWRHPVLQADVRTLRDALESSGAWTPCLRVHGSQLGRSLTEPACPSV